MPNNTLEKWEEKTLGEVCTITAGQSPESQFYNTEGNGLPFYQGKKEFTNKYIGAPTVWTTKITKEALAGDILMSVRAPVGPINYATQKCCIGRGLASIRKSEKISNDFLFYYLLSIQEEIGGHDGAVFNSINRNEIATLKIKLPPLSEQQRIVGILDGAFENIEKAKQNTLQNLNNAKELFESALNRTLKDIENLGEFKELSSITEVKDGTHDSPKYIKDGIPFITQKNIKENGFNFITDDTKYITIEDHNKFYQRSNVKKNDILISMIGANRGMACIVDVDEIFSIKNVGLIKESLNINKYYLLYYLKTNYAKQYITEKSKGGAQEFVGLTALRAFPILYVAVEEQQKIVQQLDELQEQTKKLEQIYTQKLQDLNELKQSILQKAFNGEL